MNSTPDDSVSKFQMQRSETGRIIRPWVIIIVAALLVMGIVVTFHSWFSELWRLSLIFGSFLVLAISIIRISLVVKSRYCCPVCGQMVSDSKGVLLDPETCHNCGAQLK